jgi:hypothetical protein
LRILKRRKSGKPRLAVTSPAMTTARIAAQNF